MGLLVNQMNTKCIVRSTLVGFVIAAGLMRPALAEEVKLGYVDLRRALHETEDGHKAESSLKKVFDQKQKELDEQQEDVKKEEEATRPIVERLQRIIAKIAAAENFTMILDKNQGVVFAKPHLDLTNEVIRRYNAGEEKGAAPAAKESKPAPSKKK